MEKLEALLDWGGTRKDVACLVLGGAALLASLFDWLPLPFDPAWIAIVLCGVPIVLEAVIGLITAFDIKADVLVFPGPHRLGVHWGGLCRRGGGLHHAAGGPAGGPDSGQGPGGD